MLSTSSGGGEYLFGGGGEGNLLGEVLLGGDEYLLGEFLGGDRSL